MNQICFKQRYLESVLESYPQLKGYFKTKTIEIEEGYKMIFNWLYCFLKSQNRPIEVKIF